MVTGTVHTVLTYFWLLMQIFYIEEVQIAQPSLVINRFSAYWLRSVLMLPAHGALMLNADTVKISIPLMPLMNRACFVCCYCTRRWVWVALDKAHSSR